MKSSTGQYFLGLDHVRALAAFMVFTWHFIHINNNHLAAPSTLPLPLLTEGHTGVALFMTLSGYLFAKLLDGKRINYPSFLWNRALRLVPLLALVLLIVWLKDYYFDGRTLAFIKRVVFGIVYPTLPNGGWSITVESHFYLVLPILLFFSSRYRWSLLLFVLLAVAIRWFFYTVDGEVQKLAYWTIVGRLDQFVLGIAAYHYRELFRNRHVVAGATFAAFCLFYWNFENLGGFYKYPEYPSPSPVWIIMTTVEGFAYGLLIAWYDNSFAHPSGRVSRFIGLIGTYSYSIYLLHFFFFRRLSAFVDAHVVELSNVYLALLFAPIAFLLMVPLGWLSFKFVESPFLKFRTKYIR